MLSETNNEKTKKLTKNILIIISIIIFGYCCLFPLTTQILTGQVCNIKIFATDKVPSSVEDRYVDLVIEAIRIGDVDQIKKSASYPKNEAENDIELVRDVISENYEIIGGDYTFGLRERRIQFDNEKIIYMSFAGGGKFNCPDFNITDLEIMQNFYLMTIYVEEK